MTRRTPRRNAKPITATRKAERSPGKDTAEAAAKPTATGPTTAALAASDHPDAKLFSACSTFMKRNKARDESDEADWEDWDEEIDGPVCEAWWAAVKAIVPMKPRTLAGLRAKAIVLEKATFGIETTFGLNDDLAVALARDVMAFAAASNRSPVT